MAPIRTTAANKLDQVVGHNPLAICWLENKREKEWRNVRIGAFPAAKEKNQITVSRALVEAENHAKQQNNIHASDIEWSPGVTHTYI